MKPVLLALDIGGTYLKSCLCDRDGTPLPDSFDRERVDSDGELSSIKKAYQSLLSRMAKAAESRDLDLTAVAADIPGPFDYKAGISHMEHKYTSLYGVPLMPWFEEVIGDKPVRFLHDSSAFLSGASLAHPEIRRSAGVMIGTGLGFAVMENGVILENENGGPRYSIYKKKFHGSTAEEYISGRAILRRYRELTGTEAESAKEIGDRAEARTDHAAVRVYEEIGENLSELLLPVLTELQTQALYLGGQISKSFSLFEPKLRLGLSGVSTLRFIEAAKDLDLVHLKGVARWLLLSEKDLFREIEI